MKMEKELALEFFGATDIDGIQANVDGKMLFISDLIVQYRKSMKTKQKSKLRQQKIAQEFNLIRDSLVEEVESYCKDLFRDYSDVIVFINRTSVNVYDPETGTTTYTMLSPSSHCVNVKSTKLEVNDIRSLVKSLNCYSIAKTQSNEECLINLLKDTKDVSQCIFDVITKLRYEI